ncbi:MAG TPA: CDP-glycerol glycerophosphotransferase family protein [Burkholderiales bacterium]|nr:CDP-glycerol glycerophosphotransferase family protein [Burkholderiales bacterium]
MITIAYYLRHPGNLHYFAAIKPYLDYFLGTGRYCNRIVVREGLHRCAQYTEYADYHPLFSDDCDLDDYDLVLSPTHLRDDEIRSRAHVVQLFHGMSDKTFTYERDWSGYALCLIAGQRQIDRLMRYPHNRGMRHVLVGYPKFDRIPTLPRLFDNDKKTLIYAPTWRKGGLSSLERFLDEPEIVEGISASYNLIVKPHPNIFNFAREFYDARLVDRLQGLRDIKLIRSGNVMPWFAQADLYIGDISASGYEWLYFGRPAVFLNPQPGVLRPSAEVDAITHLWQCGPLCENMRDLKTCIDNSMRVDRYREIREAVLHYSVYRPRAQEATARGVAAIQAFLNGEGNRREEPRDVEVSRIA